MVARTAVSQRSNARAADGYDATHNVLWRAKPAEAAVLCQTLAPASLLVSYTARVNVREDLQIGTGWKTTQSRGRHSLLAIPVEREDDRPRHGRVAEAGDELVALNLMAQSNLATTYRKLGRLEEALRMRKDIYSGWMRLEGEDDEYTLLAANNYAVSLTHVERFEEGKSFFEALYMGKGHSVVVGC